MALNERRDSSKERNAAKEKGLPNRQAWKTFFHSLTKNEDCISSRDSQDAWALSGDRFLLPCLKAMEMLTRLITTPFGRRVATLALVKEQLNVAKATPDAPVDKWQVFRDLCDARSRLRLRDRALAVLNALLSFHPEPLLSAQDNLVVFPSNARLAARANGIAGTTLRENLQILVEAGIIHRRDSPNGKRYARKGKDGEIEEAYGFSLAPLLARAGEFALLAQQVVEERRSIRIKRESISLIRRDIRKLLAAAMDDGLDGDWSTMENEFLALMSDLGHAKSIEGLSGIEEQLVQLQLKIINLLELQWKSQKDDGNDDEFRQHLQNQNTDSPSEFETGFEGKPAATAAPGQQAVKTPMLPLSMILRACPQISLYGASDGVSGWGDLKRAAAVVRSMLGISPSAYQEACEVMGHNNAAVVVACILERAEHISSAGGYLRDLTRKARLGRFSPDAMITALARARRQQARANGSNVPLG